MSTTIYNAYRIDVTDLAKLKQFCKDIKPDYAKRCISMYAAETAAEMISLTEYLPILKRLDVKAYEKERNDVIKAAGFKEYVSKDSPETTLKSRPILDIAQMITSQRLGSRDDGVNAEIAAFPLDDSALIITFGDIFQDYMAEIHDNPENEIKKRYDMWDWHYQDQADKPDNISDKVWKARMKTWKMAMPSGIPAEDGLVISIYNMDQLRRDLFKKPYDDKIKNIVKGSVQDDRLEAYARDRAVMVYAKDTGIYDPNDYHTISKIAREFHERYKIPGSHANKIMQDAMDEFKPYMIDFSDEGILKSLFSDGKVFEETPF